MRVQVVVTSTLFCCLLLAPAAAVFAQPSSEPREERIAVTASLRRNSAKKLAVDFGTATQVNLLNSVKDSPIVLDSTTSLRNDFDISEDATFGLLGIEVLVGSWNADRVKLRMGAEFGYGNQDVTLERNTGATTTYSGQQYKGLFDARVGFDAYDNQEVWVHVVGSQSRGDVTRDPATLSTGVVTERHDIRVTVFEVGGTYYYTVGPTTYFAGGDYGRVDYSLFHHINIDHSNTVPGASSEIDGESNFDKSGFGARLGASFKVSDSVRSTVWAGLGRGLTLSASFSWGR